ncbi:hypothetical protein CYMTET_9488 [Cymbomonas tetramitiformis]|uniref:Kinesin light chain n=1 Tax=Cymbomonas tetramitiformis TaxID=36881 RepID=A0AAE0GRP2_9CHLO|nr:hypothetical protein CYMTET_9488 [Cymbomonas tetramitiformis]|eukprot:gene1536-2164_t
MECGYGTMLMLMCASITLGQVVLKMIVPATRESRLSYLEYLVENHSVKPNTLQIATHFVSHAWDSKFSDLVFALQCFLQNERLKTSETFFFLDFLCINQHSSPWARGLKPDSLVGSPINQIGKTVLVLSPVDKPILFDRLWCLFELMLTIKLKARLFICFSTGETREEMDHAREDALTEKFNKIVTAVEELDCQSAKTTRKEDLKAITEQLESTIGFHKMQNVVSAALTSWLCGAGQRAAARLVHKYGQDHEQAMAMRDKVAGLLIKQGRTAEVEQLFLGPAAALEDGSVSEDELSLRYHKLAICYRDHRLDDEALSFAQKSLDIHEKLYEDDNPAVSASLQLVGSLLAKKEDYVRSEEMLRKSLTNYKKTLGDHHADVGEGMEKLAMVLDAQGNAKEALELYRQALSIKEDTDGPNSLPVAEVMSSLATVLKGAGKYSEAEGLYNRALKTRTKKLGKNHQDTITLQAWLADLYNAMGKYEEALPILQFVAEANTKKFPEDDPIVAFSRNNLAGVLSRLGRYEEAAPLYTQALASLERSMGPSSAHVATTCNNLAELLQSQRKFDESRTYFERAVHIMESELGHEHSNVAHALNNLAGLLCAMGKHEEARAMHQRALQIRQTVLGNSAVPKMPIYAAAMLCKRLDLSGDPSAKR